MTKANEGAYPIRKPEGDGLQLGLTKRELFAMAAMQGLLAWPNKNYYVNDGYLHYESVAKDSVAMADALINSLNKARV